MSDYKLTEHWEEWFSLPATNWSSIEGTGDEWLAIADAIEQGLPRLAFKRCAFVRDRGWLEFRSPRNCSGERDVELISENDSVELVRDIRESVLSKRPDTCVDGGGI